MAELQSLLSFMDAEDRERALKRYETMFSRAGEEGEEELIASLGSPVRQVLALETEYRQAKDEGKAAFLDVLTPPEEQAGGTAGPEDSDAVISLVHAAADALYEAEQAASAAAEDEIIEDMDSDFPLEAFLLPDEPEEGPADAAPETETADSRPDGAVSTEVELFGDEAPEPDFPPMPAAGEIPAEPLPGESETPSGESAGEGEGTDGDQAAEADAEPDPDEPVFVEVPVDPGVENVSTLTEQIALLNHDVTEEVANEAIPIWEIEEPEQEPEAEQTVRKVRHVRPGEQTVKPGPLRILAAILVTIPFLVLWAVSFALFISLGLAVMAVGFACCVAGVYLGGYVLGGTLSFMPDLLLVAGGAIGCFALALLLIWTGLWIAVGGLASVIRFTANVYRKILRKKVPRKGGKSDD